MKYAQEYKINKDLPTVKKGWVFGWSGIRRNFYPHKADDKNKPEYDLDFKGISFSFDEVVNNSEWFTPITPLKDFIPPFPEPRDLSEFVNLDFETKLVDDVDECRALNDLFDNKEFQDNLYKFVKKEYNRFHKLI